MEKIVLMKKKLHLAFLHSIFFFFNFRNCDFYFIYLKDLSFNRFFGRCAFFFKKMECSSSYISHGESFSQLKLTSKTVL